MNRQRKAACEKKWSGESGLGQLYPDGADVVDQETASILSFLVGDRTVCEIGCGNGRLSPIFAHHLYTGVDINSQAIREAQKRHPDRAFNFCPWDGQYPDVQVYLFHTVLLHVPDEELSYVLSRCKAGEMVIVSECMDRRFRYTGPDFQRDPEDYSVAFARLERKLTLLLTSYTPAYPFARHFGVFR